VYRDNYLISIGCSGNAWGSDEKVLDAFNKVEQYARQVIDGFTGETRGSFVLEHCSSFSDWKRGEPLGPGDLVATLKDKDGKGVSGKTVYFFKNSFDFDIESVLTFPAHESLGFQPGSTSESDLLMSKSTDYATAVTDSGGRARWNYIANQAINYDFLVFDKDPTVDYGSGEPAKIEYYAEVRVAFKGVAAITSRGTVNSKKESVIEVGASGQKNLVGQNLPYYVVPGEDIYFDSNSIVTVRWLNGMAMTFKIKEGFDKGGTISINYKDWVVETTVSGVATATGLYLTALGETAAGAFFGGPAVAIGIVGVILVYEGLQWAYDPILVEPHSTILIDANDDISVYTVEGVARLYNTAGDKVEVAGGQTASMSPGGEFGPVSGFKESDLNGDLSLLNDTIAAAGAKEAEGSSGGSGFPVAVVGGVIAVVLVVGVVIGVGRKRRR
jgi:hypothetical protein